MFKKPFHTKSNTLVKSSDRRKIIGQLLNDYNFPDGKESLSSYVQDPLNSSSISTHIDEHVTAYYNKSKSDQLEPIFFKVGNDIFPTVYTLWSDLSSKEELLPMIITHQFVVQKLIGGADLMVPGILQPDEGLPKLVKGDKVAIGCWERDNTITFVGVGYMEMNSSEVPARGGKGKIVKVVHMVGDYLWKQGSKIQPVKVIGSAEDLIHNENIENDDEDDEDENDEEENEEEDKLNDSINKLEVKDEVEEEEAEEPVKIDPKQMDAYLYASLYQSLKTRFTSKIGKPMLPLNSTIFYSNYMMPSSPANVTLDLKHSTFKKLNKFLKVIEKDGLVTLKDIGGLTHIKSVKWEHAKVKAHKLHEEGNGEGQESANAQSSSQGQTASSSKEPAEEKNEFDIRWLYKYPTNLAPIFGQPTGTYCAKYYTVNQLLNLSEQEFLVKENLLNKGQVKVEANIANLLMTHEQALKHDFIKLDQYNNLIKGKLQHFYQVVNNGEAGPIKKGMPNPIQVTVENRQGKKQITKLTNLEAYLINAQQIQLPLKNMCASSVAVNELPSSDKQQSKEPKYEVLVQGNQVKAVLNLICDKLGVPKAFVEVKDPTAGKGKGGKKKK